MRDEDIDAEHGAELANPAHPVAEGLVLGSQDATPLEFWVGVRTGSQLELDDLIVVETLSPRQQTVRFFGIVDIVRKRYEGAQYDSDAFRAADGTLPVDISYAAHIQVTRVEPEIFIPPHPGDAVRAVRGAEFERALYFDRMERRLPIGVTRTGEPVFANVEFLDGARGAHASITGVSGVATKTSYAGVVLVPDAIVVVGVRPIGRRTRRARRLMKSMYSSGTLTPLTITRVPARLKCLATRSTSVTRDGSSPSIPS